LVKFFEPKLLDALLQVQLKILLVHHLSVYGPIPSEEKLGGSSIDLDQGGQVSGETINWEPLQWLRIEPLNTKCIRSLETLVLADFSLPTKLVIVFLAANTHVSKLDMNSLDFIC
jgi:hypothetical protein